MRLGAECRAARRRASLAQPSHIGACRSWRRRPPRRRGSAGRSTACRPRCGRSPGSAGRGSAAARRSSALAARPRCAKRRQQVDRQGAGADLARAPARCRPRQSPPSASATTGSRRSACARDLVGRAREQRAASAGARPAGRDRRRVAASPRARRAGPCRGAARASSGCVSMRAIRSLRPTMKPGLRAAQQLVAGEGDEVGARRDRLARRRLVRQAAARRDRPACRCRDRRSAAGPARGRAAPARRRDTALVKPSMRVVRGDGPSGSAPVSGPIAAA